MDEDGGDREQVSVVAEQWLRLLHHCGMPKTDVDMLHGPGQVMNEVLVQGKPRNTLFTGYSPSSQSYFFLRN
jgi:1-pyrroline-5-carboxylate dehydrogenase